MTPLIASLSGVRGIYGNGLTPEVVKSYSLAFGSLFGPKIIIGRDTRVSGAELESIVSDSLLSLGCTPVHVGVATTPATQLAVEKLNADGGIIITASHNPAEWNALKFVASDGSFIREDGFLALQNKLDSGEYELTENPEQSSAEYYEEANNDHLNLVLSLSHVEPNLIKERGFKVAVDCVNGAASEIIPILLESLGCEVIKIHCEPNGLFPHDPEPLEKNLRDLIDITSDSGADVGLAIDPDGDRLAIIADGGKYLSEEYTLVLAADAVLSKSEQGQKVVTNLSTTKAVDDIAKKHNAEVLRTPVGEINVVQGMKDTGALIGGEGNGGVILPEAHYGRDALVAAALTLQFMAMRDEPLSEAYSGMPQYFMTKRKIELGHVTPESALEAVAGYYAGDEIDRQDGVKVSKSEGWIHVRVSNTEPILRIYTEARDKKTSELLADEAEDVVKGS